MKKKLLLGIIVLCCGVRVSPIAAASLDSNIQKEPSVISIPVMPNIFKGCIFSSPNGTVMISSDFHGGYYIRLLDKTATVSLNDSDVCIIRLPEGTAIVNRDGTFSSSEPGTAESLEFPDSYD